MTKKDDEIDASAAPLLEHLTELRQRIIYSFIVFFLFFCLCFFVRDYILEWLVRPYRWAISFSGGDVNDLRLQSTQVWETFVAKLKLAAFGAFILAFPYIAFQIYRFIAPGLYKNERMAFVPFLVVAPLLFLVGAAFVYFIVSPMIFWFGLSQQFTPDPSIKVDFNPKISEYFSSMMSMILVFGILFQLPLVVTLLTKAGLITSAFLKDKRRWAILVAFVISAMITPGDILTMVALALPIILLYEISILLARFFEKKHAKEDAA